MIRNKRLILVQKENQVNVVGCVGGCISTRAHMMAQVHIDRLMHNVCPAVRVDLSESGRNEH